MLLFRSPTYGLLVGAINGQGPRPDFNNGPGDNSNSGRVSAFESNWNNGSSPGHINLGTLKKITTACTIAALLISLFSRQNAMRRALSELKVFNKNCLTTPHLLCCTQRLTRFHPSSQKRLAVAIRSSAIAWFETCTILESKTPTQVCLFIFLGRGYQSKEGMPSRMQNFQNDHAI